MSLTTQVGRYRHLYQRPANLWKNAMTQLDGWICCISTTTGSSPGHSYRPIPSNRQLYGKLPTVNSPRHLLSFFSTTTETTTSNDKQQPTKSTPGSRRSSSGIPTTQPLARVHVAVGSNLGNRFQNIANAIALLTADKENTAFQNNVTLRVLHTSMLHETAPMYVTDQPSFLNGVVELETNLSPTELLCHLKAIEAQIGRDLQGGIRYGPRPVDLDILFYRQSSEEDPCVWQHLVMDTPDLVIPHPRMAEREFVLAPLCEVARLAPRHPTRTSGITGTRDLIHPVLNQSVSQLLTELLQQTEATPLNHSTPPERVVVMPLPRDRLLRLGQETVVMGVLNVTPDSFSDGGKWSDTLDVAVQHALQMEQDGAGIIDIGGESTRPGAKEVPIDEELARTIPVIQRIRQVSEIPISIDTRHAIVAEAAVNAGADIVNDVSGGTFDPDMLSTAARLRVPFVLMHMRGIPETMQDFDKDYSGKGVVEDVMEALNERCDAAEAAGIPRWMQIVDPGIGFAKDLEGNLSLLRNLNRLRANMRMGASTPILLGTSRKGFLGRLAGVTKPEERDYATVASCVAALCLGGNDVSHGCNIIRVHNVKAMKEATLVMDAIRRAK